MVSVVDMTAVAVRKLSRSCETYFGLLRSYFPRKQGCPGHADAKKYDEEAWREPSGSERNWNKKIVLIVHEPGR